MKKFSWLILVAVGLLWWKGGGDNDFRIGTVSDNGLKMESISWQRRMINCLEPDKSMQVWIPGGMGWYQSDKIKKLLEQEKRTELAREVFFYNFGFVPDLIIYGDGENTLLMAKKMGLVNYMKYRFGRSRLMIKKDTEIDGEMIQRDLADSRILRDDLRLTIYNLGQSNGLGGFMARVLEWSGFTVIGVESRVEKINGNCQVKYGTAVAKSYSFKVLQDNLAGCEWLQNNQAGGEEVELYFGEGFAKMLNYDTYNK